MEEEIHKAAIEHLILGLLWVRGIPITDELRAELKQEIINQT